MIEVVINGTAHRVPEGLTLLQALERAGVAVPAVCYDSRVRSGADCRLCLVEIDGESHPVAACTRAPEAGMKIETHTPALESFRRTMLEMLSGHCAPDSVSVFPEKTLHRWLAHYGVEPAHTESNESNAVDASHPHFRFDPNQCISCYRCVRVCEDLQGQFVWHVAGRGSSDRLIVDSGGSLNESSCVGCGACVDACPTAALVDKSRLERGAAATWTRTTCSYCGVGCEMRVGVNDDRIVQVLPEPEAPVNKGHLCSKGRYAWRFGEATDRVTQPMLRIDGDWRVVDWELALERTTTDLARIRERYGPDAIGVLGSSRATNEENYLIQKFARLAIGTNNVDCCARVCHTPTAAAMKQMLGTGAATNSFDDIERAQSFLIAGANPTENHPVIGARIKQQVRRGARLIVIDPRRIELAQWADIHLAPKPGTNIPLLNALAHVIVAEGLCDREFLRSRVDGFDALEVHLRSYSPEAVCEVCAVAADDIRRAARLYATQRPAMCFHGLGMTEHLQGTEGVMALVNLALLTGNLGRPGSGVNPLRGQNNVQGAAVMGCEPGSLTGGVALAGARDAFEKSWGGRIPTQPGLNLMEMIDAAAAGRLKALYVVGYDILQTLANTASIRAALDRVECVIVQDFVMNETARAFGTHFLPVATAFEKDGTFMNAERRIQRVRKALSPPGEARSDAWIVGQLARRLGCGAGFDFPDAEHIWDEVRQVWPAVAGIAYSRLEAGGIQWPCPTEGHPGTELLHERSFPGRTHAALECIDYVPTDERSSAAYPYALMTGRNIYQFNSGTMTDRTPNRELRPHDTLDIAPCDAARLRIADGMAVRITSRHGSAVVPARIDARIREGQLFATFHEPSRFLNQVTSSVRDRRVATPEYKVTFVALQVETAANDEPAAE